MKDKEFRHLGRRELLEVIYVMKKTELDLRNQLAEAEQQMNERTTGIRKAGSIAKAALELNGVFEAAQAAADDYLKTLYSETDEQKKQILAEAAKRADKMVKDAEIQAEQIVKDAEEEAEEIKTAAEKYRDEAVADAERKVNDRWNKFRRNVQEIFKKYPGLAETAAKENKKP